MDEAYPRAWDHHKSWRAVVCVLADAWQVFYTDVTIILIS